MKYQILFKFFFIVVALLSCATNSSLHSQLSKDNESRAAFLIERRGNTEVIKLRTFDENGRELINMEIAPSLGSNVVSLSYRGHEMLEQAATIEEVAAQKTGIKFLYPTPNRVKDSQLKYKNLELSFTPNSGKNFIHGLALQNSWLWETPLISGQKITYKTWLDVAEGGTFYSQFPRKHKIEMLIIIDASLVEFKFTIENKDTRTLPFGLGIHPYFHVAAKDQTFIKASVQYLMEAAELIPSGKIMPVAKTKFAALVDGNSVQSFVRADDVFWNSGKAPKAEITNENVKLKIEASKDFNHLVVFAPEGRSLIGLENQTSSTDAHNLADRGFADVSGLIVVRPGRRWQGYVRYNFSER